MEGRTKVVYTSKMAGEDHRYAVDIRIFVSVIVIAMAVSFGVGVGLGPTAHSTVGMSTPVSLKHELPPVTSVEINEAETLLATQAAADNGELHEPAGQVRLRPENPSFQHVLSIYCGI